MALAAPFEPDTNFAGKEVVDHQIEDTVQIFRGALVATKDATGELVNVTDSAGLSVAGIAAFSDADDKTGNSSSPRVRAKVDESGLTLVSIAVAGAVLTSEQDLVYATDEDTYTMTPTANLAAVGVLQRFRSAGIGDVKLFTPALNKKT